LNLSIEASEDLVNEEGSTMAQVVNENYVEVVKKVVEVVKKC